MAPTWYVDYENGTDSDASAGNGDSFATRRKTITRIVAAALAPGDTIRVMGSPAPTSLGNATWTGSYGQRPTYAIASSTNATPIVITLSGANYTAMAPAVGDTIIVNGHTTNTNANGVWKISAVNGSTTITIVNADGSNSTGNGTGGASGTVRKATNMEVRLANTCTANIAECGNGKANWTATTNVTCTKSTADFKEGYACQSIAVGASFTTGKAAYVATGTLNLSGYQQISFWIKQTAGTLGAAGSLSIKLCSDTTGDTAVDTFNIPYIGALNQWSPIVINKGSALGSSIQSIAFYVNTDNGAQTFLIDNVIACKAQSADDSLNLTSLISKNTGDEAWFGIQSINGTRVMLDGTVNTLPASAPQRGYIGTTETVTTYKRETIKTNAASSLTTQVQVVSDSGTSGSLITISGGWNRTDMSTQDGVTWFDGQNGNGYALYSSGKSFVSYDKLNFARYSNGLVLTGNSNDNTIGTMYFCNTTGNPLSDNSLRNTYTKLGAVCCGGAITLGSGAIVDTIARADSAVGASGVTLGSGARVSTIVQASNTGNVGVQGGQNAYVGTISAADYNNANGYLAGVRSYCGYVSASYNSTFNIGGAEGAIIASGASVGGGTSGVGSTLGAVTLRNFTISDSTEAGNFTVYADPKIISENHDNTAGYHVHFCDGGRIETQTTVKYTGSSFAWKMSPTSTNRNVNYPLTLALGRRYITGATTFKVWMQRSNTGLTMRLVCKGGQIAGVTSDVVSSMTANANTWEQVSITVTPTAGVSGVVEIEAQAYGGTTYSGYVSVMEIS